jgi:hypothetical protein
MNRGSRDGRDFVPFSAGAFAFAPRGRPQR